VSAGCAGRLSLAGVKGRRSAGLARGSYSRIRADRSGAVELRLSRRDLRRARRYERVRVTSVELGEFGDETTIVTLGLRLARP
jgi:hypothetical protein